MFASFIPSKTTVKSAAVKTAKVVAYTTAGAAAVYGGLVLAKRYGGVAVELTGKIGSAASEQVVGG